MSGIVLSASVRQNLLSLQSTADLLATTQNRLATGNKVNSALDNPTSFFTAQSLNNRASDIGNLLDGIGNGVQVLQAANTGITSLQKLVDTAKSIANQVLQTTVGYSTKSTVTSAAALGGTAANLVDGATIKAGQTIIVAANGNLPALSLVRFGADHTGDFAKALESVGEIIELLRSHCQIEMRVRFGGAQLHDVLKRDARFEPERVGGVNHPERCLPFRICRRCANPFYFCRNVFAQLRIELFKIRRHRDHRSDAGQSAADGR